MPLMRAPTGEKLSKRDGASSLQELRGEGARAAQVVGALAASVGLAPEGSELTARELLEGLTMKRFRAALVAASEQGKEER